MLEQKNHLLVIGAHAFDAEVTAGAVIAKYTKRGDKVTIVHLTRGEKGHPKLSPEQYARQKRQEAEGVAKALGAEVRFLPHEDGELPLNEEVKFEICDLIRELKPDIVITHWKESFHKDHVNTYYNVMDALFYAAVPGIKRSFPAHRVKQLFFAENWEDAQDFKPEIYIDISDVFELWVDALNQYAVFREEVTDFSYKKYYKALAILRGAESGFKHAEAFMIPEMARKRKLQFFPSRERLLIF